jgi:hypothetical protein
MDGLTAGRMVHYVNESGRHCAAVVAEVLEPSEVYTPLVTLFVFDEGSANAYPRSFYSEAAEVGTWHWIERA